MSESYLNIYGQYNEGDSVIILANKGGLAKLKLFVDTAIARYDEHIQALKGGIILNPPTEVNISTSDGYKYDLCFEVLDQEEQVEDFVFDPLYLSEVYKYLNDKMENLRLENKRLRQDLSNYIQNNSI